MSFLGEGTVNIFCLGGPLGGDLEGDEDFPLAEDTDFLIEDLGYGDSLLGEGVLEGLWATGDLRRGDLLLGGVLDLRLLGDDNLRRGDIILAGVADLRLVNGDLR